MLKIRSRKIALPILLLMLWTATPAQAGEWSHDDLWSDVRTFIFHLLSDESGSPETLSMADIFLPKPPPDDGATKTDATGGEGGE